jgi:HTH-type transcriptional regulator/antitoxin HipB
VRSYSPKEIGALARETRLKLALSQAELGQKIGATRYWVAQFERGKPGAELGRTLKALRALRLVVSIEPRDIIQEREAEEQKRNSHGTLTVMPRAVDLSSLLTRSAHPEQHHLFPDYQLTPLSERLFPRAGSKEEARP